MPWEQNVVRFEVMESFHGTPQFLEGGEDQGDTVLDLGIWVTNLTNDWYSWGGTCLNGSCVAVPSPPRMWGVDVKYRF